MDFPELDEIVAALRELVEAADAYSAAHPDEPPTPDDATGRRWLLSFEAIRRLVKEIDAASEAAFGAAS